MLASPRPPLPSEHRAPAPFAPAPTFTDTPRAAEPDQAAPAPDEPRARAAAPFATTARAAGPASEPAAAEPRARAAAPFAMTARAAGPASEPVSVRAPDTTPAAADPVRAPDTAPDVTQALRAHGAEIFGWLLASLATEAEATDAFSLFGEELWRSLHRHQGRCSLRTWCFMLARHCAARVREARRAGRAVPLSQAPLDHVAAEVREATLDYLRTDVKQRVRTLRDQLSPDDQALLVLRVDKDLGWRDIALVLRGPDAEELAPAELTRHAAALRKRFERVKARLRELAVTPTTSA